MPWVSFTHALNCLAQNLGAFILAYRSKSGEKNFAANLILLILSHEVVHVRLGLSELHFVHALAGEPVKEGLAPEHGRELL